MFSLWNIEKMVMKKQFIIKTKKGRIQNRFHVLLLVMVLYFLPMKFYSQTKIGGVPGPVDSNAYLQLGEKDGNKGFLMPRVSLVSTKQSSPLKDHVEGMQVYNYAHINDVAPGIYYNDGTQWIKLFADNAPESISNKMIKQKTIAVNGQKKFSTPMPINSLDKIQVFRNGKEIEFTGILGESEIILQLYSDTNEACFEGDEIKIYQWN